MAPSVGHVEVAGIVHRHPIRVAEVGPGGRAAVACEAEFPRPGDRTDEAGGIDPPHALVPPVGHVQVSRRVHRNRERGVQLGLGGRAAVPRKASGSRPGDCADEAGRIDPPHALVQEIRHVEIAGCVYRHTGRESEPGRCCRAAVALGTSVPVAGDGRDHALGIDPPHAAVVGVCHVKIAGRIHPQPERRVEPSLRGRAAVPGEAALPGPRERRDDACGVDLPDAVVLGFRHIEVASPVHCQCERYFEPGLNRRTLVPQSGRRPRGAADQSVRGDASHAVVLGVAQIEVAGRIHCHPVRYSEPGCRRRAAVT